MIYPSMLARIAQRVVVRDGCWEWTGPVPPKRYPTVTIGNAHAGTQKRLYVHRLMFQLAHGPIPAGLFVCHQCDNTLCVRPDHMFLGTAAENARDMVDKGRQYRPPRPSHCVHGHAFDEQNTYRYKDFRYCRICIGINAKRYRDRRRKDILAQMKNARGAIG